MNKFKVIVLIAALLTTNLCAFAADGTSSSAEKYIFQGYATINDRQKDNNVIFTGDIETLTTKTELVMTVSQVLSTGLTTEGDEFFAEITNDVSSDKGIIIPRGTIAHGTVQTLTDAKRLGRDAYIELTFDYLMTPDGREVPIEGKMTTKLNTAVGAAKVIAENTVYTAAGGVVGGITALQVLGIEAAIASNGYTLAGGAAIGAVAGLGISLARKGKDVLISPGDEIKVKVSNSLILPVMSEKTFTQDEVINDNLKISINNVKLEKDPFGELNTITLQLSVNNFTQIDFSCYDIGLMNDYNKVFSPSIFGDTSLVFKKIRAGDRVAGSLSFSVDNPKRRHWLVFYDRMTRKVVAKISVDNAEREIKNKKKINHKAKKV